MIESLIAICPVDNKDDKVQKATGLVSSTSELLRRRVAMPKFAEPMPSFSEPKPPAAPRSPVSRLDISEVRGWLLAIGITGSVIAIIGLVLLAQGGGSTVAGLFLLVIAACALGGIYYFIVTERHKHEEAVRQVAEAHEDALKKHKAAALTARQRFEQQLQEWQTKEKTVREAQANWEQNMYYCHRHDVVFLAGRSAAVRPEDMPNLLGIAGISLQRDLPS